VHWLAVDEDLSAIGLKGAGEGLHHRALSRAVVTNERATISPG